MEVWAEEGLSGAELPSSLSTHPLVLLPGFDCFLGIKAAFVKESILISGDVLNLPRQDKDIPIPRSRRQYGWRVGHWLRSLAK